MPLSATGSATDGSLSETAELRVRADKPASISLVHNANSRYRNLLSSSLHIAGSDIPVRRRKATTIKGR